MRFVFTKLFYFMAAAGLILLSFSWGRPWLRWVALFYDVALVTVAVVDARRTRLSQNVRVTREFDGRFAVGLETEVSITVLNEQRQTVSLIVKDEYPPLMKLSGLREARIEVEGQTSAALVYGLTPPKRGRFQFGQINEYRNGSR